MTVARLSPFTGVLGSDGSEHIEIDGTAIAAVTGHDVALVAPRAGRRADVEAGLAELTGHPAPNALRTAAGRGWLVVWTEPNQWLVRRAASGSGIVGDLSARLGDGAAVFAGGHGRVTLSVEGPEATWVLAKLAGLDFHDEVFRDGMAQSTMVAHVTVLIHRLSRDRFELTFMRSYAKHVAESLLEACRRD